MQAWDELTTSLAEFGATLGASSSEEQLRQRYLDGVRRFVGGMGEGIYLVHPGTGTVRALSSRGVSDYFVARYEDAGRARDPVLARVLATRAAVSNGSLMGLREWQATDYYRDVLRMHRIDDSIQAPIVQGERVVGTLNFGRHQEQGPFTALEVAVAQALGRIVGMALMSVQATEDAARERELLRAGLELVGQAVVITDLDSAERFANHAARAIVERLERAHASLDELLSLPGSAEGGAVSRDLRLTIDGAAAGTVRSCTVTPLDGVQVTYLDHVRHRERPPRRPVTEPLTPREREVAQLAARGLSDREIAERLFLSRHTIKGYLKASYRKLGVRSRVALARLEI